MKEGIICFLQNHGKYLPCGIFTKKHFVLIIITLTIIVVALKKTIKKSKDEVAKIIKNMTIIMLILEVIRIIFNLYIGNLYNVKEYLPLYYCSLLLYAGIMSSWGKGKIKRTGDVFLATGSIIGGIIFIIMPTTSLLTYPMLHFISIHSFFYHGTMVYLGLLVNITNYIDLEKKDILYFSSLVLSICIIALIVNKIFDSNLMFISKDFPGTPITIMYHLTGRLFTPIMIIAQMTLPFMVTYLTKKICKKINKKQK